MVDELKASVQQLIEQRRFYQALQECERALALDLTPADRCEVLQLKARIIVQEDKSWGGPAISCLREALELTPEISQQRGRVHCTCTGVYAANGNLVACRTHRGAFIRLWKGHFPESELLRRLYPHVEYNLALAYHEVECLEEAEEAYLLARKAYEELNDLKVQLFIADIHHNLIDVFQENDRNFEAKSLMDLEYNSLSEEQYGAQKRNRLAAYALYKGDHNAALLLVESGLGHPSCDHRTRAALLLTYARLHRAMGQDIQAHDFAAEAARLAALAQSSRLAHRIALFIKSLSKGGVE